MFLRLRRAARNLRIKNRSHHSSRLLSEKRGPSASAQSEGQARTGDGSRGASIVAALAVGAGLGWFLNDQRKSHDANTGSTGNDGTKPGSKPTEHGGKSDHLNSQSVATGTASDLENADSILPPLPSATNIAETLYAEFRRDCAEAEKGETAGLDAGAVTDSSGVAIGIAGRKLPVGDLAEANELIELLEALNRGLLTKVAEDRSSTQYKERMFYQLTPVFMREVDRLVEQLRTDMDTRHV